MSQQRALVQVGQKYAKSLSSDGHRNPTLPSSHMPGIYRTQSTPSLSQRIQSETRSKPFIIRSNTQASSLSPYEAEGRASEPPSNTCNQLERHPGKSQSPQRLYNVGLARSARKVDLALSSKVSNAKLRRYEQVFEDPNIHHPRFAEELEFMAIEFNQLKLDVEKEEQEYLRRRELEEESRINSMKAHEEFLRQAVENQKLAVIRKREALLEAQRRRRLANEQMENKKRRLWKMKTAAQMISANAGEVDDEVDANGEVDLRKSRVWNPHYMWLCDIEEKEGDKTNDFLFLADLSAPAGGMRSRTSQRKGRCIFDDVMYDLQQFEPEYREGGAVCFALQFGVNTAERKNAPKGWQIEFQVCPHERGGFVGTCSTSWWGLRDVVILPYASVSEEERSKFPDPVAKYYKTQS
mmetsp:Transcript_83226/g.147042  ORF Transcript_83226/g.147042 Transcript_83226/m.147042 type:complete len:409 (+) Transcript_83226:102-1328(+)